MSGKHKLFCFIPIQPASPQTGPLHMKPMTCYASFRGLLSFQFTRISLKLLHLLCNSMREIDSHIWMLRESLRESILWFSSKVRPCPLWKTYHRFTTGIDCTPEGPRASISIQGSERNLFQRRQSHFTWFFSWREMNNNNKNNNNNNKKGSSPHFVTFPPSIFNFPPSLF